MEGIAEGGGSASTLDARSLVLYRGGRRGSMGESTGTGTRFLQVGPRGPPVFSSALDYGNSSSRVPEPVTVPKLRSDTKRQSRGRSTSG